MSNDNTIRPRARTSGIIVERLDGEVLVYDLERDRAHCLNEQAATVWEAADGSASVEQIAATTGLGTDVVRYALARLERHHLLEQPAGGPGISRRDVMKRVAMAGAIGAALPVVRTIVAPTAAQAATCLPTGSMCATSGQCCSGVCAGGTCL